MGLPDDIAELHNQVTRLQQRNVELTGSLEERQIALDATRAANRERPRALNQRG